MINSNTKKLFTNCSTNKFTKGIDPKLSRDLSETNEIVSFPSLDSSVHSYDSSVTPDSQEIRKILDISKKINSKVEVKLANFVEKASFLEKISNKLQISQDCMKNSIIIDSTQLDEFIKQQDILLSLFDQVCILQSEVELNYAKIKYKESLRNIHVFGKESFECSLDKSDAKGKTSCNCKVF